MARHVFFSFNYEEDISRVSRIRNCRALEDTESPFIDEASWEEVKKKGDKAIKNWINRNMKNCSVVIVCIGENTSDRDWVHYEINKAHVEGRGLLGIHLNGMKDLHGNLATRGVNPLSQRYIEGTDPKKYLSEIYPTYSWKDDNGYNNVDNWIEEAAKIANR